MHGQNLPVLESQKSEFRQASVGLDQQRPGASSLMLSVMQYDPQAHPNVRADRLINRWQELRQERQGLRGWQHDDARGKVEGQMRQVTGAIEQDPQVEPFVRSRSQKIGINHVRQDRKLPARWSSSFLAGVPKG
jgi:hypothetical protein